MTDHDQRFKTLLKEFLPEFFDLFFPEFGRFFDFSKTEWLDKEVFSDPPEGERREVDLVAKLGLVEQIAVPPGIRADAMLALIHIEVESGESAIPVAARMPWYFLNLLRTHRLPVLPIVVFLKVGHEGLGERTYEASFGPLAVLTFRYLSVGLPALDGVEYLKRGNDLGVALSALMRIPEERRARQRAEALKRIALSRQNELRRFFLAECVETYLELTAEQQQQEYRQLLASEEFEEANQMATTSYEKGVVEGRQKGLLEGREKGLLEGREKGLLEGREKGLLEGREKGLLEGEKKGLLEGEKKGLQEGRKEGVAIGQRATILVLLEERFGSLSEATRSCVEQWPTDDLTSLIRKIARAQSLEELGLDR
jgi:hypothetical protein